MISPLLVLLAAVGAFSHPHSLIEEVGLPLWSHSGKNQGDMVLLPEQERNMRAGLIDTRYRWPNATIPFKIRDGDFTDDNVAFIKNALKFFNHNTCVTVREATEADQYYVLVTNENSGCWSYVGHVGWISAHYRPQQLNLQHSYSGTCLSQNGTTMHEFMHAFGFYHEEMSPDRDRYLTVLWQNIQEGKEQSFEKRPNNVVTDFGCGYDYYSVMHSSKYYFSINGEPTIIATDDPGRVLGQRVSLTATDIDKLDCMYVGIGPNCICRC